jgi:hypothetical protein
MRPLRKPRPLGRGRALSTVFVLALFVLPAPAPADARVDGNHVSSASAFATRIVRLIGENRYAQAWVSLYPLHRQAAPLQRYVECENLTPVPGRITSLRTLRVWDAPVHIAGLPDPTPGTKVTLRIVIADAAISPPVVVIKTVGLVKVAKHWTWVLPPGRYAAYVAGECPH